MIAERFQTVFTQVHPGKETQMFRKYHIEITWIFVLVLAVLLSQEASALDGAAVTAPEAKVEKLADGFSFTEGPAVDGQGNIYFTDIPNNRIHKWSLDGKLTTFRENSGGANGLFFDKAGNLLACEGGGRRLVTIDPKGKVTPLATEYQRKKFNSCNDLWITPNGGVYFTDPRYGSREGMEQDGEHVYYLTRDRKKVIRVVSDMVRPNGLIGTPDGKTLYIADHGGKKTYRYKINPDGTLADKKLFANEGSDGMTIDTQGNVYLTTRAVQVYDPKGKKIATIVIPEGPANVTFGGKDLKTLFVTARKSLYAVPMRTQGYPARCAAVGGQNIPAGYTLAYHQDFDEASVLAGFEFTNPAKWQFAKAGNGSGALESLGPGGYKAPVRSPGVIALIADRQFGNFILEADLLQTGKDYGHRDMCLFFGMQNPSQYYYVHMATKADNNAHNVFIVNKVPRTNIAKKTNKGIDWGRDVWHKVRLERNISSGSIKVYFDDLTEPIMLAEDKTHGVGYIGFGSFDDVGKIDNVRIWSPQVVMKPANIFKKK
jgi:gluconolactonase